MDFYTFEILVLGIGEMLLAISILLIEHDRKKDK